MSRPAPIPAAGRRARPLVLAALVVAGATLFGAAVLGQPLGPLGLLSASPPLPIERPPQGAPGQPGRAERQLAAPGAPPSALGEADGALPDFATVFDSAHPGIARLDPDLLRALRQAATDAAAAGVVFTVNSGWRSAAYQHHLLEDAVRQYGSLAEAERWVATPETSAHVSGDAVDLGPVEARAWLSAHGVAYGLCQIYRNEPWHYELRPAAINGGCPAMYADAAEDPRMHR